MILPDVNVLLFAFRQDSVEHQTCRAWLTRVVNGSEAYGISPQVLTSLIRIATHPRIYARPSRFEDAAAFCETLVSQPNCRVVEPGPRHWDIFLDLCRRAKARGNLVRDAWLAALAIEHGCEWITMDGDFARFERLRWRAPAQAASPQRSVVNP